MLNGRSPNRMPKLFGPRDMLSNVPRELQALLPVCLHLPGLQRVQGTRLESVLSQGKQSTRFQIPTNKLSCSMEKTREVKVWRSRELYKRQQEAKKDAAQEDIYIYITTSSFDTKRLAKFRWFHSAQHSTLGRRTKYEPPKSPVIRPSPPGALPSFAFGSGVHVH